MKNLYIPKGKTLRYESLVCQNIVNDGALIVENRIQARHIFGKGVVNAGAVSCRSLTVSDIDAAYITAGKLAAECVCASEVKVSGAAVVSCCLEAAYVETPKLTVALSHVGEMQAQEVVKLSDKRRSIVAALLAGFVRKLWMSLTSRIPRDAEYAPVQKEQDAVLSAGDASGGAEDADSPADLPIADLWNDFEFKRLAALYRLLKPEGYALRLVPFPVPSEKEDASFPFRDAA